MKRFQIVIPIMIFIGAASLWMLNRDFPEIESQTRTLIALGAAVLSGIITYFLFRPERKER